MSRADYKRDFAERMKELVRRTGSIAELARLSGISHSGVANYFHGESVPKVNLAIALADAAAVDFVWLATGEGVPDKLHPAPASECIVESQADAFWASVLALLDACERGDAVALKSLSRLLRQNAPQEFLDYVSAYSESADQEVSS